MSSLRCTFELQHADQASDPEIGTEFGLLVHAIALGSDAIGSICRSIAAWAEEVGKSKQHAEAEDIQPIVDSIQVRHTQTMTWAADLCKHVFWSLSSTVLPGFNGACLV